MSSPTKMMQMSGTEENPSSSSTVLHALNVDVISAEIISYLGKDPNELIKYRLVSRNWNNTIVRKLTKSGHTFRIPLRYGSDAPDLLFESSALHLTRGILENVIITLTGTAAKLVFDTVVVDRDFCLARAKTQWAKFLEIHGQWIRHLKFNIRRGKIPSASENFVIGREQVVSQENLCAIFSSVPNLETLDFCVRFAHYNTSTGEPLKEWTLKAIFDPLPVPQLKKLQKIKIHEPHGYQYTRLLLTELISMAPNLTSLDIKPTFLLSTYARSLKFLEPKVKGSMTSLRISYAHFFLSGEKDELTFPFLHLTSIELNNTESPESIRWTESLLRVHHSTLVKLVLGNRKYDDGVYYSLLTWMSAFGRRSALTLPPVMENLKVLEINFTKYRLKSYIGFEETRFPVLECLTCTGGIQNEYGNQWRIEHLSNSLPTRFNRVLKHFSLVGPIQTGERQRIAGVVGAKFPNAVCHFDP